MKKVLLIILMLLITATVANAASINGEFNGNQIVKVKANGKELAVENTPAIIYNGNTLVPINMLRQLGATVTWDSSTYSVDISLPRSETLENDVEKLAKETKSSGVEFVGWFNDGSGASKVTFYIGESLYDLEADPERWSAVTKAGAYTSAVLMEINDPTDTVFIAPTKAIRDYFSGAITAEQLVAQYQIFDNNQTAYTQPPVNNQVSQPPVNNQVSQPPASNQTVQPHQTTNTNVCEDIRRNYEYQSVMVGYEGLNAGKIKLKRLQIEYDRDQELAANGCI